ncbi:hypothetical protein DSECCO2_433690 [anaerobic digester metagenome]
MWSKPYHQYPDEVLNGFGIIVGFNLVILHKKLIHILCRTQHILSPIVRKQKILNLQTDNLVVPLKRLSIDVLFIVEFSKPGCGNSELISPDMRKGDIGHIIPDCPILKNINIMLCTQDSFFQRLGSHLPIHEPFYSLNNIHSFPFAHILKSLLVNRTEIQLYIRNGGRFSPTLGAGFCTSHVNFASGAGKFGIGKFPAFTAPEIRFFPAGGALPQPQFNFDFPYLGIHARSII